MSILALALVVAASSTASVRMAFDRHGKTAIAVQGLADVAAGRAVDIDDPVRVASISKVVVGIAVIRLAVHDVGRGEVLIDLRDDACCASGRR